MAKTKRPVGLGEGIPTDLVVLVRQSACVGIRPSGSVIRLRSTLALRGTTTSFT